MFLPCCIAVNNWSTAGVKLSLFQFTVQAMGVSCLVLTQQLFRLHSQAQSVSSLNCKFSGQEAGSSRASCLSYNLCQIWLLCDSGDPSFESRLPRGYCFLTGRPQTISPQAMSDAAEHFSGGNQNFNAFPTGGS